MNNDRIKKAIENIGEGYGRAIKRLGDEHHDSWEDSIETAQLAIGGVIRNWTVNRVVDGVHAHGAIKKALNSLVASTLSTYKSELRKKLEGMRSDIPAKSDMVSVNKEDGYNLALSDAINLLDN